MVPIKDACSGMRHFDDRLRTLPRARNYVDMWRSHRPVSAGFERSRGRRVDPLPGVLARLSRAPPVDMSLRLTNQLVIGARFEDQHGALQDPPAGGGRRRAWRGAGGRVWALSGLLPLLAGSVACST